MTYNCLGRAAETAEGYRRGLSRAQDPVGPAGFRFVDVETLRAEAEAVLGLGDPARPPREKR